MSKNNTSFFQKTIAQLGGKNIALFVASFILLNILMYYFAVEYRPNKSNAPTTVTSKTVESSSNTEEIKDGIHVETGLAMGEGFAVVRATCTACHSSKLITQNRATREGWIDMIRWMQETQKLWDLGDQEETIVNYLAKYYAPEEVGRRKNLENVEWYVLE